MKNLKVRIERSAGSINEAIVNVEEIKNLDWDDTSSGYKKRHAGYALYGYIDYNRATDLGLNSGQHPWVGWTKIMIPRSLNNKPPFNEGYKYLLGKIGYNKPVCHYRKTYQIPTTKAILETLKDNGNSMRRKELRQMLIDDEYEPAQIQRALNRMEKDGRIRYTGSVYSPSQVIFISNNK